MYLNKQIDHIMYYKLCYVLNRMHWYKLMIWLNQGGNLWYNLIAISYTVCYSMLSIEFI